MNSVGNMDDRATRREIRRRGAGRRVVDLNDIVLELPELEKRGEDGGSVESRDNFVGTEITPEVTNGGESYNQEHDSERESDVDVDVYVDGDGSGGEGVLDEEIEYDSEEIAAGDDDIDYAEVENQIRQLEDELKALDDRSSDGDDDDDGGEDEDDDEDEDEDDDRDDISREMESFSGGMAAITPEKVQPTATDLPPAMLLQQTQQRVIEKHQQIVKRREEQMLQEKKLANRRAKDVNNAHRKSIAKSKSSIKVKYRRIPSNKAALIYLDVIYEMLKNYIKDRKINEDFVKNVLKSQNMDRRRKVKKDSEREIKNKVSDIMENYYNRINEYFESLIDLKLSNSLIKTDINKINLMKNKLRLEIFNYRQDKNIVSLELKELRDEFRQLNKDYNEKDRIYREMIQLKQGNKEGDKIKDNIIRDIGIQLNKLEQNHISREGLLNKIKDVNNILERIV